MAGDTMISSATVVCTLLKCSVYCVELRVILTIFGFVVWQFLTYSSNIRLIFFFIIYAVTRIAGNVLSGSSRIYSPIVVGRYIGQERQMLQLDDVVDPRDGEVGGDCTGDDRAYLEDS